jgi:hypothetical protein
MLILIVFTGFGLFGGPLLYTHYAGIGSGFVVLVLFFILGWQVFGAAIRRS